MICLCSARHNRDSTLTFRLEKKMKTVIFFISCVFLISHATAAFPAAGSEQEEQEKQAFYLKTTEDLQTLCSLPEDHGLYEKGIAFCYGFVSGVMGFYGAIAESPKVPNIVCSDQEISRTSMVENFLAWSTEHPEHLGDAPIDSLIRSAMKKWPCSENK